MRSRGVALVLPLVLVVVAPLLTTYLAAAQDTLAPRLLACYTVVPDPGALSPNTQSVVQFERATFPPFTETGLFQTQGAELMYIEHGQFTVFSEQGGEGFQPSGFSLLAAPDSKLYARNDEDSEASLLWLRLTGWVPSSAVLPSMLTGAATTLAYQPLAIEFDLPTINDEAHLFIGDLAPNGSAPEASTQPLESGRVAVVVEAGQVDIAFEDGSLLSVPEGQWTTIDGGQPFQLVNAGNGFAEGYVAGLIPADDSGWINQEVIGGACPG